MHDASIWEEEVMIPTYEVGEPDKNPMFLEKRVYQGSSGKVYPYPVIDKIFDEKKEKPYQAVFLENDFIKIMVLPCFGGRIQRALDKTNGYDFVYYNHVIKPALVGLLGPWISGGIEFNWPQHHRPTTYMSVSYQKEQGSDGSVTLRIGDTDAMYGTQVVTMFTLRKDHAYIEIENHLYNRTALPQTFLWWANPAVSVNDQTQSVFPPDVHAVYDHGKRDVSRFPIAHGVYYKHDYSEGVDISRYKNIPVPTSYMAYKSSYNFVGGYDYGVQAGILHVADHHISPGKKQWTWGCGDFGKAWDRNLTDSDGPYIELMTGVYTDNQPDFSWLEPMEEKSFTQYFLPYKHAGYVKNASTDVALNFERRKEGVWLCVYAVSPLENVTITLEGKQGTLFSERRTLAPTELFETTISGNDSDLTLSVLASDGTLMLAAHETKETLMELPESAKAIKRPEEIMTVEELFLAAQHLEQYRHATYESDPYYLEGLKRDSGDSRINDGYGSLLLRRCRFTSAEPYFRASIKRLTTYTPNPHDGKPLYDLGLCLLYQGRFEEAYDAFYKATWTQDQGEMAWYYLAALTARKKAWSEALSFVERAITCNNHNHKALALKAWILQHRGEAQQALTVASAILKDDPFDAASLLLLLEQGKKTPAEVVSLLGSRSVVYVYASVDLSLWGCFEEANHLLALVPEPHAMCWYYQAWNFHAMEKKDEERACLEKGKNASTTYVFPNTMDDCLVLTYVLSASPSDGNALMYLGDLRYAYGSWEDAIVLWEKATSLIPSCPTLWRNLSLAYYNKSGKKEKALQTLGQAFALDESDARILLELDELQEKMQVSSKQRLSNLENHLEQVTWRDDLFIRYVELVNHQGEYQKAVDLLLGHHFHPWEGGEGKVSGAYIVARKMLAVGYLRAKQYQKAEQELCSALVYPENFGEGKLEGKKDNDIHYLLGLSLEAQGKDGAEEYRLALLGNGELASTMYYYDQSAEVLFYQGLASEKLGDTKRAAAKYNMLRDWGENHVGNTVTIDYFAVSLPDLQLWNEDLTLKNQAHCWYLMALGAWGMGKKEEEARCAEKALAIDPSLSDAWYFGLLKDVL